MHNNDDRDLVSVVKELNNTIRLGFMVMINLSILIGGTLSILLTQSYTTKHNLFTQPVFTIFVIGTILCFIFSFNARKF
jgi:hypothetical protein